MLGSVPLVVGFDPAICAALIMAVAIDAGLGDAEALDPSAWRDLELKDRAARDGFSAFPQATDPVVASSYARRSRALPL
jgi:hypothetical protein